MNEITTAQKRNRERDELFDEAVRFVREENKASVYRLQHRFGIGYTRATWLIYEMEEAGVVGPFTGDFERKVLREEAAS